MIARSLLHLLEILVLAGGWTLTGYALLPKELRRNANRPLVWATALGLGAGGTAVALTVLAMVRAFRPAVTLVVAAAVTALAAIEAVRLWGRRRGAFSLPAVGDRAERASAVALAVVLVLSLFATLAPPSAMDATLYHLRVPLEFIKNGTWTKQEESQSFQPLYIEMLFGEGLVIGGGVVAALVHWALGVGAIAMASAWGCRLGGGALWSAVIFGATGLFVWEATSAFIDLGLALFASLAFFWATWAEDGWRPVVLAGVFAGLAAGSKFTGLIAAVLVSAAGFAIVWPDWRRGGRRFVVIGALSALVASPWYVRDFLLTGNPIFPLANRLFGLKPIVFSSITYGHGRDLVHLLVSPFDLLARGDAFDQGWSVGPVWLALLPLGLLARRSRLALIVAACLIGWWLVWFYSSPQTRLLLPVMPMAAGLAGMGMAAVRASGSRVLCLGLSGVVGVAVLGALGTAALAARTNGKVVAGLESEDHYLERNSWNYVAYEAVNRSLPLDARVSVTGAANFFYLRREASALNPEDRPTDGLVAKGFTHELRIARCPLPPAERGRVTVTDGSYALRASRLTGGVFAQLCYRISALK